MEVKLREFASLCKLKAIGLRKGEGGTGAVALAQLVGMVSHTPKGCRFNSQPGHILRLRVWSLVGGWGTYSRQPIDVSNIDVSLSLSPSCPFTPLPESLCKINKYTLGWGFFFKKRRTGWQGESHIVTSYSFFTYSKIISFFLKDFILFIFRERGREEEREGEKHQCVVASHATPTGDLAHNPGMCSDWELNQRPFASQSCAQSTEPCQPGPKVISFSFL